jgi:protease-4
MVTFLSLGWAPRSAWAQSTQPLSSIPSYYGLLQWDLTSPSAYSTVAGGYANPAVYGTLPAFETQFSWTDVNNDFGNLGDWGLFLGGSKLGFGVIRNEIPLSTGQIAGVNDLRIALSGRDHNTSVGLGFGWSTGDDELVGRSDIFQIGLVHRFGRYVSLGLSGDFALNNSNQQGLFDVAVRPLADQKLTVFADAVWPKSFSLSDAPWSAGAMIEPVPGLQLIGRYFENESYTFSLGFTFGGLGIYGTPRYNKDNDRTNTTYQIRSGYPQRSFIDNSASKGKYYLEVPLNGPVKYRKFKYFDTGGNALLKLERDLDAARTDPAISGVAVNLSGAVVSRGKAWEIRDKLAQIKEAGKHVVVYTDGMGMTEFYLASVADRIVLDPEGVMVIPGYVAGRTFVKDALVKLGIGFDEWRFLKYKSAAEMLSRTSMSEADREQRLELIEDFYATTRGGVATGRRVSDDTFDKWINDDVLLSPKQALEQGLVDKLGRWDDVKGVIKDLEGSKKRYRSASMLANNRYPSTLYGENPEIAVVYALGYCGMDTGIRARKLEKVMKRVSDDRWTKAVVLRVDSPGGLALAADLVAERVKQCAKKKPVIISQGDLAASGGYWLSMYGTEIYALPQTIVGSIGVIGGWVWNDGIGEKLGHTSDYVKVGDKADFAFGIRLLLAGPMLPDRNLTPDEREEVIGEMEGFYRGFVEKVANGRQMKVEDVDKIAEGRVFSGVTGKEVGLVDQIGSLDDAIKAAKKAAGIKDDETITVVEYPKMPAFNFGRFRPPYANVVAGWFGWDTDAHDAEANSEIWQNPEWAYLRALVNNPGQPLYMLPPEYNVRDAKWGAGLRE